MRNASRLSRARAQGMHLVVSTLMLVVAVGCSAPGLGGAAQTSGSAASSKPQTELSEADAVAAARTSLPEAHRSSELWATMSGTFQNVFRDLAHQPNYAEQPAPDAIIADRKVWGVQFKVEVEICPPSGAVCQTRDGLATVFLDYSTGEWIRSTTYAPPPGQELPEPKGQT